MSGSSNLCLDVMNGSTVAGSAVKVWTCTDGTNQQWARS
ncbi:putative xylanase [Renibacterium salmoninarum ATCC 33209]|uniref:Putative xylanase n=1 Tax=Renibacterium salmoninarum (strain ATCC 33209 / DSM 20767 / JCM 11484 / NBRC 15589 / NCIMB 2235) TaxID=288705 RepID=A9WL77_RENSM|nr:putative xylanase [Renibacterium salmoninarum ATCC 33209]